MIVDIVKYSFLQNALITSFILGIILPIIGIIITMKKIPFIADSLGHINMSAIAFLYFINTLLTLSFYSNLLILLFWTISGAILIEYIGSKYINYKEVSVMVVYSIAISATMIFLNLSSGFKSSLFNILFGNINAITKNEMFVMLVIGVIVLIYIRFNYKKILISIFENDFSKLYCVNNTKIRYLIMIIISLIITMSIKILGVLLVSSLILIPNLAAIEISRSLKETLKNSIIITEVSLIFGIIIAYKLNFSASAIIVLIAVLIYLFTLLFKK